VNRNSDQSPANQGGNLGGGGLDIGIVGFYMPGSHQHPVDQPEYRPDPDHSAEKAEKAATAGRRDRWGLILGHGQVFRGEFL